MRIWRVAAVLVVLGLVGGAVVRGLPDLSVRPDEIPTTRATRGDVDVRVHTLGELGPRRAIALAAPSVGGTLQIVTLALAGTVMREGDVVLEFDRAEQQYNLQQAESELAEAEQEIVKLEADARVQGSQDRLNLLHAEHELSRAEIEVTGNEFVGRIDAQKNDLALDEARRHLVQLRDDAGTHAERHKAALAVLREKRSKAGIAADFARKNIDSMTLRAPLGGLVVLKENQNASGGFGFPGMSLPEFRQGDTVQPGTTVAEVVDLTEIEIKAKVAQTERDALGTGAAATVEVDALPARPFAGESKGVGGLAQRAFWEPDTSPQFTATFALASPSPVLRPGMSARIVVRGETLKNVTHLPRQVLFEKEGKPVVYVKNGGGFTPTPVNIVRVTENRVVLRDFPVDAEVALVNPELVESRSASKSGTAVPGAMQ